MNIIISTSEIIQSRLFVVDIATVTEWVDLTQRACHGAGAADGAPPSIISVVYHNVLVDVKNGDNIAVEVLHITVRDMLH